MTGLHSNATRQSEHRNRESANSDWSRGLAWFSFALGAAEILMPHRITHALGLDGHENLVRAYGVREIASGAISNSRNTPAGLWSRLAGDSLDLLTLMAAFRRDNPKRATVAIALAMVAGVSVLDAIGLQRAKGNRSLPDSARGGAGSDA